MPRKTLLAHCLLLGAVATSGAASQGPSTDDRRGRVQAIDAHWKTIHTKHYRIHYPANPSGGFLPFATEVASKIEGISAKVAEMVGFEAKGPIDVLIEDPMMEANGSTAPFRRQPVVTLWKTPPEPDSQLGNYESWVDLLVTHELVHLHHLMRPQNKERLFDKLNVAGPLVFKLLRQRYITEGYATLMEGRITGSGRPHGAYRAAVIRQWAIQGKLPSFEDVSGGEGYMGGSMAYLLGSAYLEWLEAQFPEDPDILVTFWKHLASKKRKGFKKAFKVTFGVSPKDSYDRWKAEVTHDAIAWELGAKKNNLVREGVVFARFDGSVTDLAVSPDGTKLMARVLSKDSGDGDGDALSEEKLGVRVWDLTGEWEKEHGSKARLEKAKERQKEKDKKKDGTPDPVEPEDRKPEFETREAMATISWRNGALPRRAWWTGNDQITFELRYPNAEGVLKPSFRTYDVKTKKGGRAPSGTAAPKPVEGAFARREIGGVWNIVQKLPDGEERQVTNTLSSAWQPAPTPDGRFLYYVRLTATGCEIRKMDLAPADKKAGGDQANETEAGEARAADTQEIPAPQTTDAAPQEPREPREPQETKEAKDAKEIQDRPVGQIPVPETTFTKGAIISLPNTASLLPPASTEPLETKDYSVWDSHKLSAIYGYSFGPSGNSYNLGVLGSDFLGRMEWHAVASYGPAAGPVGANVGASYGGWRVSPSFEAFYSREKPSEQRFVPVFGFDRARSGAELEFGWTMLGLTRAKVAPFAAFETIEAIENIDAKDPSAAADRYMAGLRAAFITNRSRGEWGVEFNATFHGAYGRTEYSAPGDTDSIEPRPLGAAPRLGAGGSEGSGADWSLLRLRAGLTLETPAFALALTAEEGRLHGDFGQFDAFHLGGQASFLVPASLSMNRLQQPALPAYTQTGDRMRRLRAELGYLLYAYYEQSVVWDSKGMDKPEYQRVAGLELNLGDIIRIGVHRPYDGAMRGRTVFAAKVIVAL